MASQPEQVMTRPNSPQLEDFAPEQKPSVSPERPMRVQPVQASRRVANSKCSPVPLVFPRRSPSPEEAAPVAQAVARLPSGVGSLLQEEPLLTPPDPSSRAWQLRDASNQSSP
jgi:hypothetical protein